jgi:aryl-alcohol dehydrogenase-like predicted oxidoreductase
VQVIYNIFDQSPEDELLPACAEHGVGVLARVPFDEGALTGAIGPDTEFPEGDFRNRYFRDDRRQQVADHVQAILEGLGIDRGELAETALRYVLSHSAVSSVIPGMRSVRNVERNCAVGDGRGLPPERVAALKAHRWERNFYR